MKKYLIGVILLCFVACGSVAMKKSDEISKNDDDDRILWTSTRKLTWDDFKGKNDSDFDSRKAETTTVILTEKTYYNSEKVPVYEIACYFLPAKSWSITSEKIALSHEQLHFDIAELYTRKIRKAFDSLTNNKIRDFAVYESIFNNFNIKCKNYNKQYDREVYAIQEENTVEFDFDKQMEWIENVSQELELLKDYEYNTSE